MKLKDLRNIQLIQQNKEKRIIDETSPYTEIQCSNNNKNYSEEKNIFMFFQILIAQKSVAIDYQEFNIQRVRRKNPRMKTKS